MLKLVLRIAFFAVFLQVTVLLIPKWSGVFQTALVCEKVTEKYIKNNNNILNQFDFQEVLKRNQIRLTVFQFKFQHIFFFLKHLFLLPQGRAPPLIFQ